MKVLEIEDNGKVVFEFSDEEREALIEYAIINILREKVNEERDKD
jgi:hypothetical protein